MKNSSNLNISCKVVFSLNKWNKKVGSPSSFGRKRPFISLNSSASIGNLSSSERARARARANHAKNDAQKGCAMQLNGITLILKLQTVTQFVWAPVVATSKVVSGRIRHNVILLGRALPNDSDGLAPHPNFP